jgi:hypothetical protein
MDFLKRSARISRKDKIPNHVIRENRFTKFYLCDIKKQNSVIRTRPKNAGKHVAHTSAGMDAARRERRRKEDRD